MLNAVIRQDALPVLQTMVEVGEEQNSTLIFPLPMEFRVPADEDEND